MEIASQNLIGLATNLMESAGIALSVATGISWLVLLLKIRSKLREAEKQAANLDEGVHFS